MSRGNLTWLLAVPALLLIGLAISYSAPPADQDYQLIRTIVDVLAEVDKNYYEKLSPEQKKKLVENMINGGLHKLDEHSHYFNEDALTRFEHENTGEFGGIGVIMAPDSTGSFLTVSTPMPGTPAYEAGIAPGDIILKIDGKSTENLSFEDARKLITGAPGTPVTLTMLRGGKTEPEEVTLTRAKIEQHAVYGYERDPKDPAKWNWFADPAKKIAMIRLERFNEKTSYELNAALQAILDAKAKGLILDLRGNPGGLLSEATKVSDIFLAGGDIVSTKGREGRGKTHSAKDDNSVLERAKDLPMVVLIDRLSASASEIVAAALQDHGRAVVIGERSYGKGSVQKVFALPPDEKRAVKITAETWWTPNGKNIHKTKEMNENDQWGVSPNEGYAIKQTLDDLRKAAMNRRKIDIIPGKNGNGKPMKIDDKDKLPDDYKDPVVEKALEYLRTKT